MGNFLGFSEGRSDTQDRKLFIGGLNYDTTEDTLKRYFGAWGEVMDSVIMKDEIGRSRGFGFITYKEAYHAQNAFRNKHTIDNKSVDAKFAVPKYYAASDNNSEQFRKLFVGGLNYDTTENGLKDYFRQWGNVVDCVIMKDGQGRSRGFGFITYNDASEVDEAQRNRIHRIDGKEVETKRAMPRESGDGDNLTVTKMFVGGLKDDTTEGMIRDVFSEFGVIDEVDIVHDKGTGRPRGFCFVFFTDYDAVDKAVLKKRHDVNGRKAEVKKAVPKDRMESTSKGPGGPAGGGRPGGPDRWSDGPAGNFSGGQRYNRGGEGSGRGRGGYNNSGGRGGFDNFGGGNFGNSGRGGGNFGIFGGHGGNNNESSCGNGHFNSNFGGNNNGNFGGGGNFNGNFGGRGCNNNGNFGGNANYNGNFGGNANNNGNVGGGRGGNFVSSISGGQGGYNNLGGSSSGGAGGGGNQQQPQQQQNWSGFGGNSGNNWAGSNAGFGSNYGNNYNNNNSVGGGGGGGGPVKGNTGFSARGSGPYGGGYGPGGGDNNSRGGQ